MAKVKCARCSCVFPLEPGRIQVCPNCGCRMRVNLRPQTERPYAERPVDPAPKTDEYDALRREYMDMMRTKMENSRTGKDGVFLSRDEYDALVKAASVKPEEPTAAPAPAPTPAPEPVAETPVPAPAPVAEEAPSPVVPAPAIGMSEPHTDVAGDSVPSEFTESEEKPRAQRRGAMTMNWVSFLIALVAGVFAALLLIMDVTKTGGVTGLDLMIPATKWRDMLPFDPVVAAVFFLPAVFAILSLISSAVKGKVSKFLLALGYLICGAGLLFFDFLYRAGGALYEEAWTTAIITENFERLNWALIVGAAICFLACVVMFITGCMIKRKSREI